MISGLAVAAKVRRTRRNLQRSRIRRGDPSGTSGLARTYQADMKRRWAELKKVIWQTVVVNDALRLDPRSGLFRAAQMSPAGRFDFRTDLTGRAEDFSAWLRTQQDAGILNVTRSGSGFSTNQRWQGVYVRAAYSSGVEHAQAMMAVADPDTFPRSVDTARIFGRPIHSSMIEMLYARQFSDLVGITEATGAVISRELAEGLSRGINPRVMARNINRQVDAIGRVRSLTLARTEIIRAHAEGALNRYEEAGVQGVTAMAEFITAQDDRVCPICESLETGNPLPLERARGMIPVHPNCRCTWLPAGLAVVKN